MAKDKLSLREASLNDAELLFIWANEKSVRNNSVDQQPIVWENHLNWLTAKLNNSRSEMFIFTADDKPLGQIRIDLIDTFWVIGYSIDKQYRGKGLGKEMVKQLLSKHENYKFKAAVKKQNIASIKVFEDLGFKKIQIEDDDFDYFVR